MTKVVHIPVLFNEALEYLDVKSGENFVDCNLGDGGHTLGILEKNSPDGKVLAIDLDSKMIERVRERFSESGLNERVVFANDNFANLNNIVSGNNFNSIDGILLDLGMSSFHIDASGGGFSFQKDEALDMRYDRNSELATAADVVNKYKEEDLERIFKEYGNERFSRQIVNKISEIRKVRPITTTKELVQVIRLATPSGSHHGKIHFATKVFQALRIEVNTEIENLKSVLPQAFNNLKKGGRLVVISFHSLEDKEVKEFFRDRKKEGVAKMATKKPILPKLEEVRNNPRARSAKLRSIIKL